jgi:CRP/FNR family transcriptional regulator, cyclic AMP receptor protein
VRTGTPRLIDSGEVCLLDADPDICGPLPASQLNMARRATRAESIILKSGLHLRDPVDVAHTDDGLGVFVLSGLLCQEIRVARGRSLELLGPGDLLPPAQLQDDSVVPVHSTWRVVETSRLAVLDREFATRAAGVPALHAALTTRAGQRTHSLAVRLAIAQIARLSDRLLLLLWHLADRWGTVAPGKVLLPLPLSHAMLAALACAKRPSVTVSLHELAERRLVICSTRGFVLNGNPPTELSLLLSLSTSDSGRVRA